MLSQNAVTTKLYTMKAQNCCGLRFQSILNLPRAWTHKETVLLMNSFSNQKRTECMSGLIPINLWGSILKYLLQNKGMVFCWNTARKRNIRMFSPDQVSQELSSISWRLFLWHSRRDSKKKMVTFYEAHKNITWQLIMVLIKHSDTIIPAPHNSMAFPRAKKKNLKGFPRKGTETIWELQRQVKVKGD